MSKSNSVSKSNYLTRYSNFFHVSVNFCRFLMLCVLHLSKIYFCTIYIRFSIARSQSSITVISVLFASTLRKSEWKDDFWLLILPIVIFFDSCYADFKFLHLRIVQGALHILLSTCSLFRLTKVLHHTRK